MLYERRRRWNSIESALVHCFVFASKSVIREIKKVYIYLWFSCLFSINILCLSKYIITNASLISSVHKVSHIFSCHHGHFVYMYMYIFLYQFCIYAKTTFPYQICIFEKSISAHVGLLIAMDKFH